LKAVAISPTDQGLPSCLTQQTSRTQAECSQIPYTPHFGFTDSIHAVKTAEVEREGVAYVPSPESYAGVHTATAKAFNKLKSKSANPKVRQKTLLIYEGCRSLVDLESVEQYRLFLRHVMTSERMWGGMVTLFVEPETDPVSLDLIRAYSDKMNIHRPEAADGTI